MGIFQKKTWGAVFIVSLIFLFSSQTWAASTPHFSFVASASSAFFYGTLAIGTQGPVIGDEVSVFDASVAVNGGCIGAVVIDGTMVDGGGYSVAAYGDDPSTQETDGAAVGNTLTFKLWRASESKYYDLEPVSGTSAWPGGNTDPVEINLKSKSGESGSEPVAFFTSTPGTSGGCAPLNVQFTDASTGNPTSWNWSFGDATAASTVQNPTHTFTQAGAYTVTLTVTNASGATSAYTRSVQSSAKPVANFSISATSGNKPFSVNFTDTSTNNPTSWDWNFGDGTSSSSQNPSHTFSQKGTYTVSLTASNACGSDTKQIGAITVSSSASGLAANFGADVMEGCAPLNVTLSNKSTGDATSWEWAFGDGQTSTAENPVHTYNRSGLYTVTLKVKNSSGETDTLTQKEWIRVYDKPLADFRVDKTVVCPNETIKFADQSSGLPIRWRWNFGDGWISNKQNPEHVYEKPGKYVVRLISSSMCGFSLEQKVSYIEVKSPEIDFNTTQVGDCSHLTVNFAAQETESAVSGEAADYQWNFGDSVRGTGTGKNATYTFAKPGTYTVTLTGKTECGEATKTKQVLIRGNLTPDFAFSVNPGTVNESIQFIDKSNGGPTSRLWNFGDPNQGTSTQQSPTYRYTAPGEYTVTLTVTNDCGSKTSSRHLIIGAEGTSVIGVESSACANIPVTFINASPAAVTTFQWNFGDNSPPSAEKAPAHTFTLPGTYQVTLNASGQEYTRIVEVHDKPAISAETSGGCAPLTVHFTSNVFSLGQGQGTGSTCRWDFGDGKESMEQNPIHTFTQKGTYTVVLNADCGSSDPITIEVKDSLQADFSSNTLTGQAPLLVTFKNKSIGANELTWDFGDGEFGSASTVSDGGAPSLGSDENPAHTYSRPGSYKVYLIASNGQCEDEKSVWVDIYTLNSILGKVVDSKTGQAIPEAQIQILGEGRTAQGKSSSGGEYSISNLRAGSYALLVSAPHFESKLFQQIRIKLGKDTRQDLALNPAAGSISGTITRATSTSGDGAGDGADGGENRAIAGAMVAALPMGGSSSSQDGPDLAHQAVTNAEGKYTLYLGHEGSYQLTVSADGYVSKTDDKQGQGHEINFSVKDHTVDIALATRPWQPKVTISSMETQESYQSQGQSDQTGKQTEIFIYTDQNFSNVTMTTTDSMSGNFSASESVDGDSNRPCYKVIYSGYTADDAQQVDASITFTTQSQTVTLPYTFTVYPRALPGQAKCLKRVGRPIIPAQGGRIDMLGWIDLDGDGQMDLYDNSFIEIPVCSAASSQVIADAPVMACLDRICDPTLNSLSALYRIELMDPDGNRIQDTDLSIREENPLIVHLHFDSASFDGSIGDLVMKYQDLDGNWKAGLQNLHLTGNNLVFTTPLLTSFAIFSSSSSPSNLVLSQDPTSLTRLNLMWSDNAELELGFEIWQCLNEEDPKKDIKYALLTTAAPNETQYIDSSCELGKVYSYKARALTDLGATAYSNHASLQIIECDSLPIAPRDLKIQAVSKNQVILTWIDQSACESGFEIYRKDAESQDYQKIGTIVGNSYTDTAVKPGCKYFYVVKAKSSQGDSDSSNEVTTTTTKKSSKSGGMCFISSLSCAWSTLLNWAAGK